jgi:hypothetical protein
MILYLVAVFPVLYFEKLSLVWYGKLYLVYVVGSRL